MYSKPHSLEYRKLDHLYSLFAPPNPPPGHLIRFSLSLHKKTRKYIARTKGVLSTKFKLTVSTFPQSRLSLLLALA